MTTYKNLIVPIMLALSFAFTANVHANPVCGDGYTDPLAGEQCDDGNAVSGDGCSANCALEPRCGDGTVDSGEACDDGNNMDGDGCSANCTVEAYCGDGILNDGEQCDDGNRSDGDGCSSNCTVEPYCGDGKLDAGEQCDDGNNTSGDGCSAMCETEKGEGDQGCTPGYWKQPHHFDSWTTPYTPDTLFSTVFENAFPGKTLLQVLQTGGGGLNALGRHAVAALLNAASGGVDYGMTTAEVIAAFNAVYPGTKTAYNAAKNEFEADNQRYCPLN